MLYPDSFTTKGELLFHSGRLFYSFEQLLHGSTIERNHDKDETNDGTAQQRNKRNNIISSSRKCDADQNRAQSLAEYHEPVDDGIDTVVVLIAEDIADQRGVDGAGGGVGETAHQAHDESRASAEHSTGKKQNNNMIASY